MLKSWTQSNLHWSILQHRYGDLKRLCCRGNPLLPISGLVGNPKPSYFTAIRHRGGWPPRSSRSLLAATLTLLSGGFQLTVALGMDFYLQDSGANV
jgi:hypothetical protein